MSSQLIRKHLTFQETSEILIFKSSATVRRQVRNNPEKHFINSRHFFSWTFSTILFTFSIWRDFARSNTSLDEDFLIANVMKVNDLSLWSRVDVNYYKRGRDTARGFFCWRISSREQKYTAALSYFTGKKHSAEFWGRCAVALEIKRFCHCLCSQSLNLGVYGGLFHGLFALWAGVILAAFLRFIMVYSTYFDGRAFAIFWSLRLSPCLV